MVAINSKLGWVLSGPCDVSEIESGPTAVTDDTNLNKKISNFWSLDAIGIAENEKSVYDNFLDEVRFIEEDRRYQVKLPFKENHPIIEDQYQRSLRCLMTLKAKLDKDINLREKYDKIMRKQMELGIIEKAETEPIPGRTSYLSHFPVLREGKNPRVVYNGSSKTKGPSLNDCLYKGDSMIPLIFDMLLRFRVPHIAISADIEAAYLQILVAPEDRDFERLLYFDDISAENPKVVKHRFTRVAQGRMEKC